jgi:hypothetical protein
MPRISTPWIGDFPRLDPAPMLTALPPMPDVRIPTKASLAKLGHRLPPRLLSFFATVGFGRFGEGFLSLAHPHELDPTLAEWLGGFDPAHVPFGRTALGDLIYFRDLRARAVLLEVPNAATACDVSVIDVRHKRSFVAATSLDQFIGEVLGTPETLRARLRKDLFDGALARLGPPAIDEVYGFVPLLALGGVEEPHALERMSAAEHLAILFQV